MQIKQENRNGTNIAIIFGEDKIITDAQSALDLAMTVKYETGAERIVIPKEVICENFFILSTGLAGEILQKFMNYHIKAAIYGDYSKRFLFFGFVRRNHTKTNTNTIKIRYKFRRIRRLCLQPPDFLVRPQAIHEPPLPNGTDNRRTRVIYTSSPAERHNRAHCAQWRVHKGDLH